MDFSAFVDRHLAKIEPLEREMALAYWDAAVSGSARDFERYAALRLEHERIYADREAYRLVESARAAGRARVAATLDEPRLRRMAELLFLRYRAHQADPVLLERIVTLGARIENRFTVFRAPVDGRPTSANDVCRILRESGDVDLRRRAWEGSKAVGREIAGDLVELVRLRNRMAEGAGFENYHALSLALGEQDEPMLEALFDELEALTGGPFHAVKREIDAALAERFATAPEDLAPWHYHDPFFQEAPDHADGALDALFEAADVCAVAASFFGGIGMPVDDILARSDLGEREGKNQHAFCTDIDRRGDIRILCNVRNDFHWMETLLHECGHAVYDKYIDRDLPYLLRTYPHLAVTEASAMFFGALARDPGWLRSALGLSDRATAGIAPALRRGRRASRLVFARWAQVMYRFERELYRDPERDLGALWWELVERYQGLRRPEGRDEPDWAAKIHIVTHPVYYHNYMLGELIAAQIRHVLETAVPGCGRGGAGCFGNPALGEFFRERVYRPGNIAPWTGHVERISGEPLTARHFAAETAEERH